MENFRNANSNGKIKLFENVFHKIDIPQDANNILYAGSVKKDFFSKIGDTDLKKIHLM